MTVQPSARRRRVVVAPDKFAGSMSATLAAAAIADGVRDVVPEAQVVESPVADGGDGTLDALVTAGWRTVPITVRGPTGQPGNARLAIRGVTAVAELAECCGRSRLPGDVPAPLTATTFGLGEAVRIAAAAAVEEVVVAIGGSASTDGGLGFLNALGVRVLDVRGNPLVLPTDLVDAVRIDVSDVFPQLRDVRLTLATDVVTPLLGPSGSARLFGSQKGADEAQVELLEWAMARWAALLHEHCGRSIADVMSSGAGGGVVAGVVGALDTVLETRVLSGADFVLDSIGIDEQLSRADLVIVGEGSLDEQTRHGKAPSAVARRASARGCTVCAVVGRSTLSRGAAQAMGIDHVETLQGHTRAGEDSVRDASPIARRAAARVMRVLAGKSL